MTSTRASRRRKSINLTLSPECIAELRRRAAVHPDRSMSAVVEDLVMSETT